MDYLKQLENDLNSLNRLDYFEELLDKFNFKKTQAEFLLELCEGDLDKLNVLFMLLRKNFQLCVPSNKEELTQIFSNFKTKHGVANLEKWHQPNFANSESWMVLYYPGKQRLYAESVNLSKFYEHLR